MEVYLYIKIILIFLIMSSKFSVSSHQVLFHAIERAYEDMQTVSTHSYRDTCKAM